jgi:hypothetical protein
MSTSVRQRVPERLVGPLGMLSLLLGLVAVVLGYIITVVGLTTYWNLNGLGLSQTESLTIIGTGLACLVVAYVGYRGFMTFAT